MKLSIRELKKIKAALPTGSYDEIAKRASVGIATVKGSLTNPDRFNAGVIKTALEIIEEQKEMLEALKNKIKDL
ncbi:hypothetical protein [Pedobacter antarcticus]|uniref:hypothetical protein n=1 Tax=Pedobacter antarcticus TaxID=34086 RepID=UPI00292E5837|nr:hypothetical protein [Pedobacter antarcticus]